SALASERETLSSSGTSTMRGSGLHQRIGSSSENQGKIPWRYPASSRSGERSPPAASSPFGCLSARCSGGDGASPSTQGMMILGATRSALHLLFAVIGELAHDAASPDRLARVPIVLERQTKFIL